MELPPEPLKSEEATGRVVPFELPFINIQRYLKRGGLPVPDIYRADLDLGLLALEDLGDRTLEAVVGEMDPARRRALYRDAMDLIVALQRLAILTPDPGCVAFGRSFDRALLRWELDHFVEWLLEADRGVRLSDAEREIVAATFEWLAEALAESPATLVHRDFQSRNLMVVEEEGRAVLRVIDFQDALMGTRAYDLVALLRDSYVELEPSEVAEQVEAFSGMIGATDTGGFRSLFHRQTIQRKLKDAGRFVFIDRVRKNPSFLRFIPASLRYVRDALREVSQASALAEVLARHIPELR